MQKAFNILLVVAAAMMVSCGKGDENIRKRDLIPEKDLVNVLTDLYLTDGLLTIPIVRVRFSDKDSSSNYMDVISEHGYTMEQMNRTIHYYLLENPEKLEKLHDRVVANLSMLESQINSEVPQIEAIAVNLWQGPTTIAVPETGVTNQVPVDIQVSDTGLYTLSFNTVIYEDDQSINPKVNIFFWKPGDTEEGIREYWDKVELIRDGSVHRYSLEKRLIDPSFTHIRGWLLEHDPQLGRWQKHMRVTNIQLNYGDSQ